MSDGLAIVRSLGALLTILGLLAGALWAVRRFNLVLPGTGAGPERRLAVVERLSIDPRRSLALLRRDGVEHLVLLAPEGHLVIESRIAGAAALVAVTPVQPPPATVAEATLPNAARKLVARIGDDFGALVDRARQPLRSRKPTPSPARRTTANRRKRRG